MEKINLRLNELSIASKSSHDIEADDLRAIGLKEITLRDYQLVGVNWLLSRHARNHGCILADEMGLGKTCQSISFILYLSSKIQGDYLILSPLSVLANWQNEISRFAPSLKLVIYQGDKEKRERIRHDVKRMKDKTRVFLTTYEICLKDEGWLRKFEWQTVVVDEAHRLKNRQSLLHQSLLDFNINHSVLLTGTPVQNNLEELYSLLAFVAPRIFKDRYREEFIETFQDVSNKKDASKLHKLLKPFLLRRLKHEVVKDLPMKSEIVLYHGMSSLQKRYYKAILTKDFTLFEKDNQPSRTKLLNVLMQLRKCVNHPYLFDGVEPEPFQLGEHLIEASGKLVLLDQLLKHLKENGHKVLLFSQMTRMLDILQDYLGYRDYTYERLDGSVRGEERFLAVKNFNQDQDTFLFLLSTKAGGVGLNLVGADTVIFVDSDFNPQNDLQAAARAHRIGQTRPVKVVRLVGRSTVEEIILRRAEAKLKLTENVIEGGQFSHNSVDLITDDNQFKISELVKFGVDTLLADEHSSIEDVDFEEVLGASKKGEWSVEDKGPPTQNEDEKAQPSTSSTCATVDVSESMYVFEGTDYSKATVPDDEPTEADLLAFEKLMTEEKQAAAAADGAGDGKRMRKAASVYEATALPTRKARAPLTEEEKEKIAKRKAELAEERQKKKEEAKLKREQKAKERKEALWKENGYKSLNITLSTAVDNEKQKAEDDKRNVTVDTENDDVTNYQIRYVMGDVTKPQACPDSECSIVVHCVDDSGSWGSGGLFSALDRRSDKPGEHYALAGEMKDLALGDAHLIPLENNEEADKKGKQSNDSNNQSEALPGKAREKNQSHRTPGKSRDDKSQSDATPSTSRVSSNQSPNSVYVSLMVTQHRDRHGNLSGILLNHLDTALKRVASAARDLKASVHLPRIGHSTPAFNWYGTERLIRKHLASTGIPTYIYYFPRRKQQAKRRVSSGDSDSEERTKNVRQMRTKRQDMSESDDDAGQRKIPKKPTRTRDISDSSEDENTKTPQARKIPQKRQRTRDFSDSGQSEEDSKKKKRRESNSVLNRSKSHDVSDSDNEVSNASPQKKDSSKTEINLRRRKNLSQEMSDSEEETTAQGSSKNEPSTSTCKEALQRQGSVPRLPNFLDGVNCYLRVKNDALFKRLKRFLIAYGGELHSKPSKDTTHIIVDTKAVAAKDTKAWRTENESIIIKNYQWLLDCFEKRRKIPE